MPSTNDLNINENCYVVGSGFIESRPVVWEYTYFTWDAVRREETTLMGSLNDFGAEGWELVSVSPPAENFYAVFYFKRQKA